jgi:hypothetical protein
MSTIGEDGTPCGQLAKHEVFTPIKTYSPMTVRDLASAALDDASKRAV